MEQESSRSHKQTCVLTKNIFKLKKKKICEQIYQALFQEGVMVARKKFGNFKHQSVDLLNIYVVKVMQSLESQGYVSSSFSWGHYYYTLTTEGIDFLKNELNLPHEIVPRTLIKQVNNSTSTGSRYRGGGGGYNGDRGGPRQGGNSDLPRNRPDYGNTGNGDRSTSWRRLCRDEGVGRGTPVSS